MTPTDEFWVCRRVELWYRLMKCWNLRLGQLPLKIIFNQNFSFHRNKRSKFYRQANFRKSSIFRTSAILELVILDAPTYGYISNKNFTAYSEQYNFFESANANILERVFL